MRRTTLILLFVLACAQSCAAGEETLHGFVVGIPTPTTVAFDDFGVTRDNRLSLEINPVSSGNSRKTLEMGSVRVGEEVEIQGDYKPDTHQLTVKSVKILPSEERRFNSAAFPDKPPELQKTPAGWSGFLMVDGMRVHITDATAVTFRRNKTELAATQARQNGVVPAKTTSLASLETIGANTMAHYEGVSQKDGTVLASKVEFEDFELQPNEKKLLSKLVPRIQKGDALISQPDELYVGGSKFKLVSSKNAQDYVQKLGESLIPAHQKELPAGSPLKIDYRFYLAEGKESEIRSFADGVIVVRLGIFDGLENEAQLAYQLAIAVAEVEERDSWRLARYNASSGRRVAAVAEAASGFTGLGGLFLAPMIYYPIAGGDTYFEALGDQADRLALEWMLAAGYDIREAPRAYKAYALAHPDHTQIRPKPDPVQTEKNEDCAARRSFLMIELRSNYSHADYSSLKKDSDEFHAVARQAHQAGR
jgi:hypothetical protein